MSSQSSNPDEQSSPDEQPNTRRASRDNLLDELESIKDLLEDSSLDDEALDAGLDIDIPILNDMVPPGQGDAGAAGGSLLDLKTIFDDDIDADAKEPEAAPEMQAKDAVPGDTAPGDAETQMDFEGLDTDIEIPSFKLAVTSEPEPAPLDTTHTPAEPQATAEPATVFTPDPLKDLELPTLNDQPESAPATDWEFPEDDVIAEDAASMQPLQEAAPEQAPDIEVDIDFLIQEVVDEVIPLVEDQLRQRLAGYPAEVIRQLAEKYVKN